MKNTIKKLLLTLVIALFMQTASAVEVVTYYHNDPLGSPIAATDANGKLLWKEDYQPYGNRLRKQNTDSNQQWFTGKHHENDIDLSYFGARWYDPNIGRFMGVDPVGFKDSNIHSHNRYAYANNNPYLFVDPDGNSAESIIEGLWDAGNLIGAIAAYTKGYVNNDQVLMDRARSGVIENGINIGIDAAATFSPVPGSGHAVKGVAKATKGTSKKLSKVKKEVREETIGDGKFTKKTKVFPGKGPGQSRSEMEFVKNSDGKLIRSRKFSFDRGNKFQHKKPARGGPEGRPANEN